MGSCISSLSVMLPRTVTIYDYRLGLLYWTMAIFTYGYVVRQMIIYKSFVSKTPAEGFFNPLIAAPQGWPSASTAAAEPYCKSDATFNLHNNTFGPFHCEKSDLAQVWTKTLPSTLFVDTMVQEETRRSLPWPSTEDGCKALFSEVQCDPRVADGTCACNSISSKYTMGVEALKLTIDHALTSNKEGKGELRPKTYFVTGKDTIVLKVESGQVPEISMGKLLESIGAGLDCPSGSDASCVPERLSGITLDMQFNYYDSGLHYKDFPSLDVEYPSGKAIAIVVIRHARSIWTTTGNKVSYDRDPSWGARIEDAKQYTNRYATGILLNVQTGSGLVGDFSFSLCLMAILNGYVMLSFARMVTVYVAKLALGDESKIYKKHINEELSFATCIARFAAQSLIAYQTFRVLDKDGDGIEREELTEHMQSLMKGKMSKKDISTAVSVLFALGNKDSDGKAKIKRAGVGKGLHNRQSSVPGEEDEQDNYLDPGEFIDLATDSAVTFDLLARVIKTKFDDFDTDYQVKELQEELSKSKRALQLVGISNGGDENESDEEGSEISAGDLSLL